MPTRCASARTHLPASGSLLAAGLMLLAASPSLAGDAARREQLERSGDLLCEFRKSGTARPRRTPDLMIVIEQNRGTGARTARIVSSRASGAREVRIYEGDTGVHLVEDVASSVRVTTLLSCEIESGEGAAKRCLRYAAVNAWHFDASVKRDPDAAFRKLPGTSYHGFCEAWHMGNGKVVTR